MWLSILVPSLNSDKLEIFRQSLLSNIGSHYNEFEFVIDDQPASRISDAFNNCYEHAIGDWIWIANDDLICRTKGWDNHFYKATKMYSDNIAMFYPNDLMFEHTFACFPLVHRTTVKKLFPMPYIRYKIDDSLSDIFPIERKHYLNQVVMEHTNHDISGQDGFLTYSGKIYPINSYHGKLDSLTYNHLAPKREMIKNELCKLMKNEFSSVQ